MDYKLEQLVNQMQYMNINDQTEFQKFANIVRSIQKIEEFDEKLKNFVKNKQLYEQLQKSFNSLDKQEAIDGIIIFSALMIVKQNQTYILKQLDNFNAILQILQYIMNQRESEILIYSLWALSNATQIKKYNNEFVLLRHDVISKLIELYHPNLSEIQCFQFQIQCQDTQKDILTIKKQISWFIINIMQDMSISGFKQFISKYHNLMYILYDAVQQQLYIQQNDQSFLKVQTNDPKLQEKAIKVFEKFSGIIRFPLEFNNQQV